jgi:transcription elongation factor Elf1
MASKNEDGVVEVANEMYWESSASVNQIAERLDLSKGSLYSMIQPLPAEAPCPACGAEMAYPNRTALEKGFLICSDCGFEEEEEVVRGVSGPGDVAVAASDAGDAAVEDVGESLGDRVLEGFPGRIVAGATLLGVAAGLVIARSLRSR